MIDFASRMKDTPVIVGDIHNDLGMDEEMQTLLNKIEEKQANGTLSTTMIGDSYPEDLIGKTVIVNSYRVSGAVGHVSSYIPKTNHYWVHLKKKINKKSGGKTNWHKCNAGNVRAFIEGQDDIEQTDMFKRK
jgi:hypothetical protein